MTRNRPSACESKVRGGLGGASAQPIYLTVTPIQESLRSRCRGAAWTETTLFVRYRRDHDPATREVIADRYLPLARHLARRYRGRADIDDLNQVAAIALLKAIDRFDPDRGLAFTSFAHPTIVGEIKRYFRDFGWTVRVPRDVQELKLRLDRLTERMLSEYGRSPTPGELAQHAETSVEHVLEALAAESAHFPDSLDRPLSEDGDDAIDLLAACEDPGYGRIEDAAVVDQLLDTLSPRERLILRLRFEKELTQAEIGRHIGLSQMQISRLIRGAIAMLQQVTQPSHPGTLPPENDCNGRQ